MSTPEAGLGQLVAAARAVTEFSLSRQTERLVNPAVLREFVALKRALRVALEPYSQIENDRSHTENAGASHPDVGAESGCNEGSNEGGAPA